MEKWKIMESAILGRTGPPMVFVLRGVEGVAPYGKMGGGIGYINVKGRRPNEKTTQKP